MLLFCRGNKYNFITGWGTIAFNTWFDDAYTHNRYFTHVYIDGKGFNFITEEGNFLSTIWFKNFTIDSRSSNYVKVYTLNDMCYLMNKNGELKYYNDLTNLIHNKK